MFTKHNRLRKKKKIKHNKCICINKLESFHYEKILKIKYV